MKALWSDRRLVDAQGQLHSAAALGCPRCGRVTLIELFVVDHAVVAGTEIHGAADVVELRVLPSADDLAATVKHLPADVEQFFQDAQRALAAGLPDAAAVQLRKTLEAAADKKGIHERNLVDSIRKLVDEGYVTLDFKDVLTHIRKIGNSGAHFTSVQLTEPEVERSVRFTTQVLRNLFEVPGELAELAAETAAADGVASAEPVEPGEPDPLPTGGMRV